MPGPPKETVKVKTGIWARAVSVGNGADEGVTDGIGVPSCGSKEVLVGDGTEATVDVQPGSRVSGKEVGTKGDGVLVRGCKRYDPVIAIAVLVLLACCTAASLAGPPAEIQITSNNATNRPVMPSACK